MPATPWEVDDLIGTWQRDVAGHRLAELSVDNLVEILVEVLDEGSVAAAGSILECLWTCDHPKGEATLSALTKLRARASAAVLERVIGRQRAAMMLMTGRRIRGEEAERWGLVDQLVSAEELDAVAMALAQEIAAAAPLAVASTRRTLRGDLRALVEAATDHELAEQAVLMQTEDFVEGVRAVTERRPGRFIGR